MLVTKLQVWMKSKAISPENRVRAETESLVTPNPTLSLPLCCAMPYIPILPLPGKLPRLLLEAQ